MRYDTDIYFQRVIPGEYDQATGNYKEDTVTETKRSASVTDTGVETMNLIYGGIKQGICTIQLQNHYKDVFDRIRIGEKLYRVDFARTLRVKHIFIVSEVQ